jgi:o-succinylbenzoate synthase
MIEDRIRIEAYRLALRRPWRTAAGELHWREGWLLRIVDVEGVAAWGECAPLPEAGTESKAAARSGLMAWRDRLPGLSLTDLWQAVDEEPVTPAVRCALEAAVINLVAERRRLPVACLLNPQARGRIAVNAAVGCADDGLPLRAKEASDRGFRVLKVKLGLRDPQEELDLLRSAAAGLPATTSFRLDANGAWDEATARWVLAGLAGLPVESVEEPLAGADPDGLRELAKTAPCPLALDESLPRLATAGALADLPVARIVLKPMVLGGVRPCLRLAAATGRDAVVTTALEAAPGRWLAAHLAAAMDTGLSHGLDTGSWFDDDVAPGPVVESGVCQVFG